jgi:acetyl-CoA synthetase
MSAEYWARRRTPAYERFRSARDLLQELRLDHEQACRRFRWPRATAFNWALEWFDVIAAGNAQPALDLVDDGGRGPTTMSYAALSARSDTVAGWLRDIGVARGDRVMVVLDTQRELWETMLACLKVGAVVIPTYTELTATEAAGRVTRGRIRHVICRGDLAAHFADAPLLTRVTVGPAPAGWSRYPNPDQPSVPFVPTAATPATDVAFCYFTSGTTAAPKLVAHTHASYPVGHLSSMYWNGLLPGDRHCNLATPGWAKHSWSSLFVPLSAGATIVVAAAGRDPAALPQQLVDHAVNSVCAPPSGWRALRPYLCSARPALREATSAGEPLDGGLADEIERAWGVPVRDGYGQTETTGLVGTTPGLGRRTGWLGLPLPGFRVTLRDPMTGEPAQRGEVCVDLADRPVGVMAGYLDDPVRTAAALGADRYRTGDLGEIDAGGRIRLLGRGDDVFKSFDHRVSPYELEAVLAQHPAVAEVAVVPRAHPVGGAVPHAVAVLHSGYSGDEALACRILAFAAERLGESIRPRSVEFVDRLPRTSSGKVRRAAMAETKVDGCQVSPRRRCP